MREKADRKKEKQEKYVDVMVFGVLLLVVSAITFTLFYRQTLGSPETGYHSDMKAYILEMQGLDSGYSFPYPVFFKFSALLHLFVGPAMAVALATMLLNSMAIVVLKCYFNRLMAEPMTQAVGGRKWLADSLISLLAISLFFISMLYPPSRIELPGILHKYLGVFTANPFHNATYMAARPFAILSFFQFAKLLDQYEEGAPAKDYIWFSLFLLLVTMTKPSFTIVLVGAAGLIMVYRMIRSKFKNFLPTILLGLCFIPTFLDLLYQYKGVFVPEEGAEGGIGFGFGTVWAHYCHNIPLAICLAVGFPLLVLVLHIKELKSDTLFRFSWQIYLMSFAMAFLLYEKGFRMVDFNFSWGYMYGIFFAFVGALPVLVRDTAQKKKPLLLALQWLAFLAHLICGLYYFYHIFLGQSYY